MGMQVYESHAEIVTLLKFGGKVEPRYTGYLRNSNADRFREISGSSPGPLGAVSSPRRRLTKLLPGVPG
jgi:hypothetical protein